MGSSQGRAMRNGTTFYAINLGSNTQELNGGATRINWNANVQFGDWFYWGVRLHVAVDGVEVGSWAGACTYRGQVVINVSGSRDIGRDHSGRSVTVSAWTTSETVNGYGGVGTTTSCQHGEWVNAKPSYTVSYNANGGSGAPGNQTKWYGENLVLSGTGPTRTGHNFAGWATSASGAVAYQPGATYSGNAALTLYAKWTPHTYTVSYNANGGSGAPGNQTKTYGQTLKLSTTIPKRTNYNFKGWGTSAGSTSVAYAAGANYTNNSAITLYAIWELAWLQPRITNLQAARCDSAGTLKEDGTYAKVTFNWATDRTISSIKIACNGVTTDASGSGTSGSVSVVIGANALDAEKSYPVSVTVTDAVGGVTISTTVAPINFIMDIAPSGSVAFGMPAANNLDTRKAKGKKFSISENTDVHLAGCITGYESYDSTGVTNAWRYKTLAKTILPVNSDAARGAVRIVGTIGRWINAGSIDVTIPIRGTSVGSATVTELSHTAFDPDATDGSCGAIVVIKDSANYLHFIYAAVGYNWISVNLFGNGVETFDLSSQPWSSNRTSGEVIFETSAIWKHQFGGYPAKLEYTNGYYGMVFPDGSSSEWMRTTSAGLIPYQSGGASSSLGTANWPFTDTWTNNIHLKSNVLDWSSQGGLKGRVMKQIWSGNWSSGSITVPDLPYYNVILVRTATGATSGTSILATRTNHKSFIGASGYVENSGNHVTVFWADLTSGTVLRSTGTGSNPAVRNEKVNTNFSNPLTVTNVYGIL